MRLNWPMLRWGGRRLIAGSSKDIKLAAEKVTELWPQETITSPPAFYLDGALDDITGLSPWRSWDVEEELISGGPADHSATHAYLIRDVMISGGYLYKGAAKSAPGFGDERLLMPSAGRPTRLDAAHLVSCYAGSRFFGPFLTDSMPLELLPDAGVQTITMQTKDYGHEPGYRALYDLPAPPKVLQGHVGQLTIYDDVGQNSHKKQRYRILQDRTRQHFADTAPTVPGVYLKRGATGEARILTNEDAIEAGLASLGFDIVEPAVLTVQEVARRTLNAPIVVSVEGSHMAHTVFSMAENGSFVVLQPPDRFAMAFKEITDSIGLGFGFLVGTATPGGFSIDPDDLNKMIDKLHE